MRIFNPDGSEAELSGNGVRQAVMYLRQRGLDRRGRVHGRDRGGRGEAADRRRASARWTSGRARLRAESDYPAGADDGRGTLTSDGREFAFQFVQVGNPQVSIEAGDELEELDLAALRARRSSATSCSRTAPTRRSGAATGDDRIRARIFERGVGETMASGTGATGAAVAATLRGVASPVTVVLDGGELVIDVAGDLRSR